MIPEDVQTVNGVVSVHMKGKLLVDKPLHVIPEDVQTVNGVVSVHMKGKSLVD